MSLACPPRAACMNSCFCRLLPLGARQLSPLADRPLPEISDWLNAVFQFQVIVKAIRAWIENYLPLKY